MRNAINSDKRLKFYVSQFVLAEANGRVALAEYYRNKIKKLTKDTVVSKVPQ